MILLGKTLEINRGDSFSLNYSVFREDKVPYVILREWKNPYILLQIRSGELVEKNKGAIYNYWIDCSSYPKFDDPEPHYLPNLNPTTPPDPTGKQYLWYVLDADGNRDYVYFPNHDAQAQAYNFNFTKTFFNNDTSKWIQSTWWYEISMVTGELTLNVLNKLLTTLGYTGDRPDDAFYLLDQVCKLDCKLKNVVNPAHPITQYVVVNTLQKQHKLVVR